MKKPNRDVANRGLRTVVYFLILAFFLFPILWIFATAFKTGEEFMHTPPIWIPRHPTLTAFAHAIEVGGLGALKNSLIISISATALSLIVGSLAGYGLACYRLGGDDLPFFILSLRFMPAVAVIFPFLLAVPLAQVDGYLPGVDHFASDLQPALCRMDDAQFLH